MNNNGSDTLSAIDTLCEEFSHFTGMIGNPEKDIGGSSYIDERSVMCEEKRSIMY